MTCAFALKSKWAPMRFDQLAKEAQKPISCFGQTYKFYFKEIEGFKRWILDFLI